MEIQADVVIGAMVTDVVTEVELGDAVGTVTLCSGAALDDEWNA